MQKDLIEYGSPIKVPRLHALYYLETNTKWRTLTGCGSESASQQKQQRPPSIKGKGAKDFFFQIVQRVEAPLPTR